VVQLQMELLRGGRYEEAEQLSLHFCSDVNASEIETRLSGLSGPNRNQKSNLTLSCCAKACHDLSCTDFISVLMLALQATMNLLAGPLCTR
jgi:hypothetical protein